MIYFIFGDNRTKVQNTAHGVVAVLQKKRPDALTFRITGDEWNKDSFAGIAGGQGLFESKYIVVLDSVFENEEAAEYLESELADLKTADHAFVFVEYSPKVATKKILDKFSEKSWDVADDKKVKKESFNVFSLTDALGERNRRKLWVLYQKALMSRSEPEEIHGILFWQIKSLLLVAQSKSADEAGLKPFVWSKSKKFLNNYSIAELKKMSGEMVDLYHCSRLESGSLEDEVERFVLRL